MTKPASASAGPLASAHRAPQGIGAERPAGPGYVTAASAWGLRETDFLSKRPR